MPITTAAAHIANHLLLAAPAQRSALESWRAHLFLIEAFRGLTSATMRQLYDPLVVINPTAGLAARALALHRQACKGRSALTFSRAQGLLVRQHGQGRSFWPCSACNALSSRTRGTSRLDLKFSDLGFSRQLLLYHTKA